MKTKPCPFCRSTFNYMERTDLHPDVPCWHLVCSQCFACGPIVSYGDEVDEVDDELANTAAIHAWNRRDRTKR